MTKSSRNKLAALFVFIFAIAAIFLILRKPQKAAQQVKEEAVEPTKIQEKAAAPKKPVAEEPPKLATTPPQNVDAGVTAKDDEYIVFLTAIRLSNREITDQIKSAAKTANQHLVEGCGLTLCLKGLSAGTDKPVKLGVYATRPHLDKNTAEQAAQCLSKDNRMAFATKAIMHTPGCL